jgi:ceramide glucosyltransferase
LVAPRQRKPLYVTYLHLLGWLLCVMAGLGGLYTAAAAIVFGRFVTRPPRQPLSTPAVTIMKPLHGTDRWLDESLETYCHQNYTGKVEILFGVHQNSDLAVSVVRSLQARHPTLDIGLVIDDRLHGPNRKVSNLINIRAQAKHGVLIMSDADVRVPPDYVCSIVAALGAPGVGVVSCLYLGQGVGGLWSRAVAMAINYDFLPSAVLAKMLGVAQPCFGPTIAITTQVLDEIGGLGKFAPFLAEDYEIGNAVRAHGYSISIPAMTMTTICTEESLGELFTHELRWARTIRRIARAGHVGSVVTYPLPLSLIGATLLGWTPSAAGLVLAILGVRMLVKLRIDSATRSDTGPWWLIPLRDVLSFGVFLASFSGATVEWRGRRFRVGRDGVLTEP